MANRTTKQTFAANPRSGRADSEEPHCYALMQTTPLPARGNAKGGMMPKLSIVVALLLAPVAVAAQAPAGTARAPKPPEQLTVTGKSKLVCEKFIPTGSIKPQKICRSQDEWTQVQNDSLTELQRLEDRAQRYRQMRETTGMMLDGVSPN